MYNFEKVLGFNSFAILLNSTEDVIKTDLLIESEFSRRFMFFDTTIIRRFPIVCIFRIMNDGVVQQSLYEPDRFAIRKFNSFNLYSSLLNVNDATNFTSFLKRVKETLIAPKIRYAPRKLLYDIDEIEEKRNTIDDSYYSSFELPF